MNHRACKFYFGSFQIANLQDDNRVLERLTKTKEAALLEAEREVQIAKIKAALVDDLQNKNQELMKQNEINQVSPVIIALLILPLHKQNKTN